MSPIKPALASGKTSDLNRFPVWIELKYDGVRMLLHKSTDQRGNMLTGAYTRNGNDWLEMINGLDSTIRSLPCSSIILDGESHGTLHEVGQSRPATVYDVMSSIRGEGAAVTLRYSAFDLLYFNGRDLTEQPLSSRREFLSSLIQIGVPFCVCRSRSTWLRDRSQTVMPT